MMRAVRTWQQTLRRPFRVAGIGLHGGRPARVTVKPAEPGAGRSFVVRGTRIPATLESVIDTYLATSLGRAGERVSMVEHLCAALYAEGIDNAEIHVDGDEVPVLDGSARLWCEAIRNTGIARQGAPCPSLRIEEAVRVEHEGSWAMLVPSDTFELEVSIDFAHRVIGAQRYSGTLASFRAELAWARTFGFLRDADRLHAAGLARGASLDNTVVYDDERAMNPLRSDDEAVRHKALDVIGDVALLGRPLLGRLVAHRAGHALHVALMTKVCPPH